MEYIKTGNIISGVFKDGLDFGKPKKARKQIEDWILRGDIERCFNCKHYKQLYIEVERVSGNYFNAVYIGKCYGHERVRNVKPDNRCEKFEPR